MTMRQLMSHTAGFDVNEGYVKANLRDSDLQAMIDKLATLPLAAQPGSDWRYGPSVDIQGYIVEKLSGQKLDSFLRTQIFEPLGMKDTGFWVDAVESESRHERVHLRSGQAHYRGTAFRRNVPRRSQRFSPAAAGCFRLSTTTSGSRR